MNGKWGDEEKGMHGFMVGATRKWWGSYLGDHLEWLVRGVSASFCQPPEQRLSCSEGWNSKSILNILEWSCMISFWWFSRHVNKWVLEMSWSSNHSLFAKAIFSRRQFEQDPNSLWLLLFTAGFTVGMPLFTACWLGVGGGLWGIYFCSGRLWGRLPVFVNYGLWITLSEILENPEV